MLVCTMSFTCADDGVSTYNSKDYHVVQKILSDYRKENGKAPDCNDFFSIVLKPQYSFTGGELAKLYKFVKEQQTPKFSAANICSLIKAKRDSVRDIRIFYKVKNIVFIEGGNTERNTINEYTVKGNRILFDRDYIDSDSVFSGIRQSYDGKQIVDLRRHKDNVITAGIRNLESKTNFFVPDVYFNMWMLFDSETMGINLKDMGDYDYYYLLDHELASVFEKHRMIADKECLVVGGWNSLVFLAVDYDFAPIAQETYTFVFEKTSAGETIIGRYMDSKKVYHDLTECYNGIWLPISISTELYDKNATITKKQIVDFTKIEINKGLNDDYFTDFIPDDTYIADAITGLTYKASDKPSINSLLKDVVKSKRVMIFRYISVTAGFIMIITALILKYRTYLKNRSETT